MNLAPLGWLQAHGDALQVGLFFGLFTLLAVIERLTPFRRTALGGKRRWTANLALTFLNLLTLSALPISFLRGS